MPLAKLVTEVRSGDLQRALKAQRDHLAGLLADPEVPPASKAAMHARLTDVLVRLEAMAAPEVSKTDELAAARRKRRTGS